MSMCGAGQTRRFSSGEDAVHCHTGPFVLEADASRDDGHPLNLPEHNYCDVGGVSERGAISYTAMLSRGVSC